MLTWQPSFHYTKPPSFKYSSKTVPKSRSRSISTHLATGSFRTNPAQSVSFNYHSAENRPTPASSYGSNSYYQPVIAASLLQTSIPRNYYSGPSVTQVKNSASNRRSTIKGRKPICLNLSSKKYIPYYQLSANATSVSVNVENTYRLAAESERMYREQHNMTSDTYRREHFMAPRTE